MGSALPRYVVLKNSRLICHQLRISVVLWANRLFTQSASECRARLLCQTFRIRVIWASHRSPQMFRVASKIALPTVSHQRCMAKPSFTANFQSGEQDCVANSFASALHGQAIVHRKCAEWRVRLLCQKFRNSVVWPSHRSPQMLRVARQIALPTVSHQRFMGKPLFTANVQSGE